MGTRHDQHGMATAEYGWVTVIVALISSGLLTWGDVVGSFIRGWFGSVLESWGFTLPWP